jgi:hypothetical protein
MQPLPRDNLAGSSRRGPERGGADLCALQNTHRIGRPLCLENPRPQGGMLLYHAIPSPLTAIEHSQCGSAWPAKMAPSPAASNTKVAFVREAAYITVSAVSGSPFALRIPKE